MDEPNMVHILIPSTLQLDLGRSDQCSIVGLCLCFHLFLDKGFTVIFKTIISLTTGQDKISSLLLRALGWVILVDSWEFL